MSANDPSLGACMCTRDLIYHKCAEGHGTHCCLSNFIAIEYFYSTCVRFPENVGYYLFFVRLHRLLLQFGRSKTG